MNKDIIQYILKEVEKKFDRGKSSNWKNRDFEDLSFSVHQETKVLISVATLKRIFGKVKTDENYSPQESTLDALANYAHFDPYEKQESGIRKYMWYILPLILIVFGVFYVFKNDNNHLASKEDQLQGSIKLIKTEGNCPTTAYFELEVPDADVPVYVNFGDGSKSFKVEESKTISHFYAYPGQFIASLKTKNEIISKSQKVWVTTNGWQAFSYYYFLDDYNAESQKRYYPVPLNRATENGVFHVKPRVISSLGIDTTDIVVVKLSNYKLTGVKGDDFQYKARLKNSSFWPAVRCYSNILLIQGKEGKIEFKLTGEGCSAFNQYYLSEIHENGRNKDLGFLVVDHANWMDVEILNENKKVQLIINDKVIFTGKYSNSIGEIIGTSIEFHGSGDVDYVSLVAGGKKLFENEF